MDEINFFKIKPNRVATLLQSQTEGDKNFILITLHKSKNLWWYIERRHSLSNVTEEKEFNENNYDDPRKALEKALDYAKKQIEELKDLHTWWLWTTKKENPLEIIEKLRQKLANYDYTKEQIKEIYKGLEKDLLLIEVESYMNTSFSPEQMKEIRLGFTGGLTLEEVKSYANPELTAEEMRKKRLELLKSNKYLQEEVKFNKTLELGG